MFKVESRPFEIFCGTGGVGKTTLATSRAIHLARQGKKVLLITIDPAKRLKEILRMDEATAGTVTRIQDPCSTDTASSFHLDALLMSPEATMMRIAEQSGSKDIMNNRIIKILVRPYGGMNEIMAIIELQFQAKKKLYDVIVLDTPPGHHFIDFLQSCSKIQSFFDSSFVELFKLLGKKIESSEKSFPQKIMGQLFSTGLKKLLGHLEKVTGKSFVDDFVQAILAIYQTKNAFLEALEMQKILQSKDNPLWFMVTSVEQDKIDEALEIKNSHAFFEQALNVVLLNKCNSDLWQNFDSKNPFLAQLKSYQVTKEEQLKLHLKENFTDLVCFTEIFDLSPLEHVRQLTLQWEN